MHNEYVTTCCILSKKDKLLLLKYASIDITPVSDLLQLLTTNLMDQCYKHVEGFHKLNQQKNKKYYKLEPLVVEQLKDMEFVHQKFIDYFSKHLKKSKEDLLTYVLAFQMTPHYLNNYIYQALIESLKKEFSKKFWDKYNLDIYELGSGYGASDFYILRDHPLECSTGVCSIQIKPMVDIIDQYVNGYYGSNRIDEKLDIIKLIGNIMDNYYNAEIPSFNEPFKDSLLELIDNIKVARSLDKPKTLIKRI